jgi:hypothetical protein
MLLLLALGTLCVATASLAGSPPKREGWVVGVAYGTGRAKLHGSDSLKTSGWIAGPAQSIRLGFMVNPTLMISYEHQAWLREQGLQALKVRASVQLEALAVTGYPVPAGTWWNGFYYTAGAGWAHDRLTLLEPLAPGESAIGNTYEPIFSKDEYGWGWYGGLGYEIRISRNFATCILATYNATNIGGSIYDRAEFIPVVASLNWSF